MYKRLFEEKEYIISISPTSSNTFIAYDPVRKERLYKKGTTNPIHFKSEKEAQEQSFKTLKKRYPNYKFVFA